MQPLALRPTEAAKTLGISRAQLYRLLQGGSIQSFRVGKMRLIAYSELERFVTARRGQ